MKNSFVIKIVYDSAANELHKEVRFYPEKKELENATRDEFKSLLEALATTEAWIRRVKAEQEKKIIEVKNEINTLTEDECG